MGAGSDLFKYKRIVSELSRILIGEENFSFAGGQSGYHLTEARKDYEGQGYELFNHTGSQPAIIMSFRAWLSPCCIVSKAG